jgi:hypothetical protein
VAADDIARGAGLEHVDAAGWYFAAFAALACADLQRVRALLSTPPEPDGQPVDALVDRIRSMSTRATWLADSGRLDFRDLRGWHYVLTNGVLLTRSPFGEHMNGRFGYLRDSVGRCRTAIARIQRLLTVLGIQVPQVLAPQDADSRILATAMARRLEVPLGDLPGHDPNAAGLLVLYKVTGQPAEVVRALRSHHPDRPLWIHSADWTRDEPIAGDFTTVLAQSTRPDWQGATSIRPAELRKWANMIVNTPPTEPDEADLDDLLHLLKLVVGREGALRPAATRGEGQRLKQWAASPVASARF